MESGDLQWEQPKEEKKNYKFILIIYFNKFIISSISSPH